MRNSAFETDDAGRASHRLVIGARIAAAGLVGFGLILWIAANWTGFDKWQKLGLAFGVLALSGLAAILHPAMRVPGSFLGLAAIGGLLALIGQIYQSGADPWQLFALWAALGLPLALAARHDAVLVLWALVAQTGIGLWSGDSSNFAPRGLLQAIPVWSLSLVLTIGLGALARIAGQGRWAMKLSGLMTLAMIATHAATAASGTGNAPVWMLGLAVLIAGIIGFCLYGRDLTLMAAATLGADVVLIVLVWNAASRMVGGLFGRNGDHLFTFLGIGLVSALIVAASTGLLIKFARGAGLLDGQTGAAPANALKALALGGIGGLVARDVRPENSDSIGWPIIALHTVGALFAMPPFLFAYAVLFGWANSSGTGMVISGLLSVAVGIAGIRRFKPLRFGQQLSFIVLVIGAGLATVGLVQLQVGVRTLAAVGLVSTIAVALLARMRWIAGVAGAVGAVMAFGLLLDMNLQKLFDSAQVGNQAILFGLLTAGLAFGGGSEPVRTMPGAPLADSYVTGFVAIGLMILAGLSGSTFLLGGPGSGGAATGLVWQIASVVMACGASVLLWGRFPWLAEPLGLVAAASLILLSFLKVPLGPTLAILAVVLLQDQRKLAMLAGLVVLWIIGSFYYWLGWPLINKAYLMMALGAVLGAVAALAPAAPLGIVPAAEGGGRFDRALIAAGVLATVAVAIFGIRGKEAIIAGGRILHVALAPVDPRSLIQGDYMALRFALPNDPAGLRLINDGSRRPVALARADNRQVATVHRIAPEGTQAGEGEFALTLTKRKGRWSLGTDAWYFAEGSAKKFEAAKFGTFRVSPAGDMILVGMADEHLRPIQP